jgi:hypothetical protein
VKVHEITVRFDDGGVPFELEARLAPDVEGAPAVVDLELPPMDPEGRRAILALLTRVEAMARENIQRWTEYPKKL